MGTSQIVAMNILVWGAAATYYYLLYRLKSSGLPVVWFGGLKALKNYEAFFKCVRQQQDVNARRRLKLIVWVHLTLMVGTVVGFFGLIILEAQ
jgi:hypothetical protein